MNGQKENFDLYAPAYRPKSLDEIKETYDRHAADDYAHAKGLNDESKLSMEEKKMFLRTRKGV